MALASQATSRLWWRHPDQQPQRRAYARADAPARGSSGSLLQGTRRLLDGLDHERQVGIQRAGAFVAQAADSCASCSHTTHTRCRIASTYSSMRAAAS
jgi:hypothetical protein